MNKISIVIPVYNEEKTLEAILRKVENSNTFDLAKEVILVDDGSTDGTKKILEKIGAKHKVIAHERNLGKGAALRTGFAGATGDLILIQDADLELDPADYPSLIRPIVDGKYQIVYGTRANDSFVYPAYYLGLKVIAWLTNTLYGSKITDVYCGYKVYKSDALKSLKLTSNDFGIEQELTIKALKAKYSIFEVPVSYSPRTFSEGKKLRWSSGIKAIWLIAKHKFVS